MHNPLKIWAEHSLNRIPSKARRRRIAKATRAHDSPTAVAKLVELESILTGEGAASSEPATRRVATRLAPRTVRGSPDTMKDVALLVEQLEGGRVRAGAAGARLQLPSPWPWPSLQSSAAQTGCRLLWPQRPRRPH
jgi:hypothetical protein